MGNNREYLIPRDTIKVNDTEFPTMWNGYRFGAMDFQEYREDFHRYVETEWTRTRVGTGTVIAGQLRGGQISMTTSAADNDNVNIQWETAGGLSNAFVFPQSGKLILAEFRYTTQSDATQLDSFIGLAGAAETDVVGTPPANGIFFRKDDGDTQIDFVSTRTSISSTAANIHTLVADTFVTVGFKITGLELVEYFVNGIKISEFNSNIPNPSTGLTPTFAIQAGEAAIKRQFVDYFVIAQER